MSNRYFPAITLATWGLMLASMPAWPVDCERWPQLCIEQPRVVKKFRNPARSPKSTGRRPWHSKHAVKPSPAPVLAKDDGTAGRVPAQNSETIMYRQIVPLPVATSPEPRIIPLPSRMPDLSSRNIVAARSPVIAPRAVSWTRSRDGIAAIMLGVAGIYIAFVAYACVPITRGKSHEPARYTTARRRHRRLAFRHGLGTRVGKAAPQPARHQPHFA